VSEQSTEPSRRRFLARLGALGVSLGLVPRILRAKAGPAISQATLSRAGETIGLDFTEPERELMLEGLTELRDKYAALRQVPLTNDIAPALRFAPIVAPPPALPTAVRRPRANAVVRRPDQLEEVAFWPVSDLAELVRTRQVTSEELTRLYIARLRRYDEALEFVITVTEERALEQARRADRELAAGRWRGPLHGIPWGAKDLLAVRGYRTTWGAKPFEGQEFDRDAAVVRRLDDAGAVLIAKLTLGALAWGDVWFGGTTRNPWNLEQGSSGSSAGPASATAAGCVGFAIGSETWGSIVSPSTRCGVSGMRPTFGRVSRHGAMALSWSMDKLGPMCRSAEDCALVFSAMHGHDPDDPTTVDAPFAWHGAVDPGEVRLGYVEALFDAEPEDEAEREWLEIDRGSLAVLRDLGFTLVPIELPELPIDALSFILSAEAAAAFDDLTRGGRDDELVRQVKQAWPNVFRQARLIPAVEYIQANRVRTIVMRDLERRLAGVDVYVSPTFGGDNLLLTNLTGHPQICVPNGFRADGTPTSITFTGRLWRDDATIAVAHSFQRATDHHRRHPELDA